MKFINSQKKMQQGFTLIELVVVIVILGILAVTAAPKFIDLTGDARASVVEAVKGSINSAADMAHAKALVKGETASTGSISAAGSTITLVFGWPDTASIGSLLDLDSGGDLIPVSGSVGSFTHNNATTEATCVAVYADAADATSRPSVTSVTTGC
jgi:MSHA pilin protein MshA